MTVRRVRSVLVGLLAVVLAPPVAEGAPQPQPGEPCAVVDGRVLMRGVDKGAVTLTFTTTGEQQWVNGTPGDDVIAVLAATSKSARARIDVDAGAGNDVVCSLAPLATLLGGDGDDLLAGTGEDDRVTGGPGDDTMRGGPGSTMFYAGTGDADVLDGGVGRGAADYRDSPVGVLAVLADPANGGVGWARGVGADSAGTDTLMNITAIYGTSSSDVLIGGPGRDYLSGRGGADVLVGLGGVDSIDGGGGPDRILGGHGDDWLSGDRGRDLIRGGPGDDRLWGREGADWLRGGAGSDVIDGGPQRDHCTGGRGRDTSRNCETRDEM